MAGFPNMHSTSHIYAGSVFALGLISLVSNLLLLTGPIFMLQVYDRVLASHSIPTLVALFSLVVVLYTFYAFVEFLRSRMMIRVASIVHEAISAQMFRTSIRLRMAGGTAAIDPLRDVDSLRQFVAGPGPISLLDLPWLPIYLSVLFLFHPWLGWLAIVALVLTILLLVANEVFSQRPSQEVTAAAIRRQTQSDEIRRNAESVLAMGMQEAVSGRWQGTDSALVQLQQQMADRSAFYSAVTKAFRFLVQSAVLALGAFLVLEGEITAGLMIGASIVSSRSLAPVEQAVAHWRGFVGARQAWKRIKVALKVANQEAPKTILATPSRGISVKNLVTGPDRTRPLLQGVSFSLKAGEGLGVLGLTGSGKTSLARALCGVWPVLQGEIRLDGSELSHYDFAQLGCAIGFLPQVVDLLDGTVSENISRFQDDATDEDIRSAAGTANVHELITSLPKGYDTPLGERGAILSAGQRQRIGLARALYRNPFLLILDEPNSNLDAEGDAALTAAIVSAKARGAIVVIIAHRPTAIIAADKVLFLQAGRQAAFGPKEEVLRSISRGAVVPAFGTGRPHG